MHCIYIVKLMNIITNYMYMYMNNQYVYLLQPISNIGVSHAHSALACSGTSSLKNPVQNQSHLGA